MIKSKKAASLSGWTEAALFVSLFVLLVITLFANMNVKYNKNYDGTFGLSDLATTTKSGLSDYQTTLQQNVNTGQASSTGLGLSLTTTWGIVSAGAQIMWQFVSGGYVEQLCGLAGLPIVVAQIIRILFVLSIGFIIIKLLTKIKP